MTIFMYHFQSHYNFCLTYIGPTFTMDGSHLNCTCCYIPKYLLSGGLWWDVCMCCTCSSAHWAQPHWFITTEWYAEGTWHHESSIPQTGRQCLSPWLRNHFEETSKIFVHFLFICHLLMLWCHSLEILHYCRYIPIYSLRWSDAYILQ